MKWSGIAACSPGSPIAAEIWIRIWIESWLLFIARSIVVKERCIVYTCGFSVYFPLSFLGKWHCCDSMLLVSSRNLDQNLDLDCFSLPDPLLQKNGGLFLCASIFAILFWESEDKGILLLHGFFVICRYRNLDQNLDQVIIVFHCLIHCHKGMVDCFMCLNIFAVLIIVIWGRVGGGRLLLSLHSVLLDTEIWIRSRIVIAFYYTIHCRKVTANCFIVYKCFSAKESWIRLPLHKSF